jgi:pimeloyl-ACP methyl ester carboxylesterase
MNKTIAALLLAIIAFALAAARAASAVANGVQPNFDASDPSASLFPSDLFTVPDGSQLTGLRVNLSKPDCSLRPSDCNDVAVLDRLDGFNLQPRLSIPFTGPIDLATVSSETVFLFKLGCLTSICPGGSFVGINQVVWDPATNTLYAESDQLLDQDARYLLVVTDGVHDTSGDPIDSSQFRKFLNYGQTKDDADKAYRAGLLQALEQLEAAPGGVPTDQVAAASLFTTESATALLEKIRGQLAQTTPAPAGFLLGSNGERTVFPLASVSSIAFTRQVKADPTQPDSFDTPIPAQLDAKGLNVVPGAVGTIAFGSYRSPDYETAAGVIPAVGTLTGTPAVQSTNEVYFNLFLPAGPAPAGGWPVVIAGHGNGGNKNTGNAPVRIAAKLAQHGLATIEINAVGHGGGPDGTLTVTNKDGTTITLPAGGRGVDTNGDGDINANPFGEGLLTAMQGPDAIVFDRDGLRQTVVDLMQLVREIQVGVDVDGDSIPDLNPAHIYYFGNSMGGLYGTALAALDPSVQAAVLGGTGEPIENARLQAQGPLRAVLGQLLAARTPPLVPQSPAQTDPINAGNTQYPFNENLPPRNQPPLVNNIPGAIPIQDALERIEWAMQSSDPVAYAPHLRKAPLAGVPEKRVLFTLAQGDPVVRNTTTVNVLRAGDLADRTLYFRGLDAYAQQGIQPNAMDLHEFLFRFTPAGIGYALAAQESTATFLASNGDTTIDPDGAGPLFETPIAGPLP